MNPRSNQRIIQPRAAVVAALAVATALLSGCAATQNHVIAASGTVIGVELSQSPASGGTPQAKLGYNRAEFAYVPTNRREKTDGTAQGSEESADVIMELKYSGIFSTSSDGGIYQRLAVGKNAVQSGGASLMFVRSANGTLPSPEAIQKAQGAAQAFSATNPPPTPR